MASHFDYLHQALVIARQQQGFCAPNPAVGAVVVKNEQIIATGSHLGVGKDHAEVNALKKISAEASQDAIVYVTLEPCCHQGRTPPCTDLLIQRGIKMVYFGLQDPNPLVWGKGQQQLENAGIPCVQLSLAEIDSFYASYCHWLKHQRPWVTAKLAMSVDGKVAGLHGKRVLITGHSAQQLTHQLRKKSDAILTTVTTIINDDPALNVRLSAEIFKKKVYVLDRLLRFPIHAQLMHSAEEVIVLHQPIIDLNRKIYLEANNIRCIAIPLLNHTLNIQAVLQAIGKEGIHDLLLEAGGTCFEAFALAKQIQTAFVFIALKWLGPQAQLAFTPASPIFTQACHLKWHALNEDTVCEFNFEV